MSDATHGTRGQRPDLQLGHWLITQADITAYAEAAGANDPIHTGVGRMPPGWQGGTIAQGMLVLAVMTERLVAALPSPAAFYPDGEIDVRFRSPVRPGERLDMRATPADDPAGDSGSVGYRVVAEAAGRVVIDGTARVPVRALG